MGRCHLLSQAYAWQSFLWSSFNDDYSSLIIAYQDDKSMTKREGKVQPRSGEATRANMTLTKSHRGVTPYKQRQRREGDLSAYRKIEKAVVRLLGQNDREQGHQLG